MHFNWIVQNLAYYIIGEVFPAHQHCGLEMLFSGAGETQRSHPTCSYRQDRVHGYTWIVVNWSVSCSSVSFFCWTNGLISPQNGLHLTKVRQIMSVIIQMLKCKKSQL